MDYETFKEQLISELQKYYGEQAEVEITNMKKNNGTSYDGIQIRMAGTDVRVYPVIRVEEIYRDYSRGELDMAGCVQTICRLQKEQECPETLMEFASKFTDWDYARQYVYPALVSTAENEEQLKDLVSIPLLDLSVVYIVRKQMNGSAGASVKVSDRLLQYYGISRQELHRQAMENMSHDGYSFRDMKDIIRDILCRNNPDEESVMEESPIQGKMFVLTNNSQTYGAAGILDREMIRQFAKGRDFYIMPSSIHESIFVVADEHFSSQDVNEMVREVNRAMVLKEERLADHGYFYNAALDELSICA